jgi:tripartite-type tricarboxylate transporter receptor subunit TctC
MRKLLLAVAVATMTGSSWSWSVADEVYPSHPITMIVPFAPGGATDVIGRAIAERMRESLGQPVIVANVAGANGNIGVGRVALAEPDGYTIGIGHWSTHVVNGAVYTLPYDLLKDLEPISPIADSPLVVVSKNAVPAKDLRELIGWLKANPNSATLSTPGAGSPHHIAGILFQKLTGTHFEFVPYRGGAPAMQDVLAGHIDLTMPLAITALPHVRAGKIRAYAVTAKTRLDTAPDIPTVDEAGVPGLYISVWHGLWAPKGTPKDIIGKLNAAVVDALADPTVRSRLADLGQEIFPRAQQTPQALGVLQRAEIEKWWPIIKAANIKAE